MPAPHSIDLRERVVRACERTSVRAYERTSVAENQFRSSRRVLVWLQPHSSDGFGGSGNSIPSRRSRSGGGNRSPVDLEALTKVVVELRDATTYELTAAYNQRVAKGARVHRSSVQRALRRAGYVFKKNASDPSNNHAPTSKQSARASRGG